MSDQRAVDGSGVASGCKVVEVSWPTGYVPRDLAGAYTVDAERLLVTVNRVNTGLNIPKLDNLGPG